MIIPRRLPSLALSGLFALSALASSSPAPHDQAAPPSSAPAVEVAKPDAFFARAAARARPRRLIFNNDGGETRVPPAPIPALDGFLPVRTTPLAGTQVDTIVFDTTSGTFGRFAHDTKVAEPFLVREGRYRYNILPDHLAAGTDPLRVVIAHCRQTGQEVFWTMRMNDIHDSGNALLVSDFKKQHPDFLFGTKENPPKRGMWSSVDYDRPEVRELAYRVIAEVAARYDVDGIELDFWRHPTFFRRSSRELPVLPEDLALMTELIHRIRGALDAEGQRRGKPILLAIKAPDSVEYCRLIGLDLERWLADGAVDLLVFGGYFQLNPWTRSVELGRRHGVPVYACLPESRVRDPEAQKARMSLESLRGRALAAWAAGVDGIEMFNHFNPHAPLWRELGSPELLRTLPKVYFASVQGASASRWFMPAQAYTTIPTLTPDRPDPFAAGQARSYELFIGDDLRQPGPLSAQLRLRVSSTSGQPPRVRWDHLLLELKALDVHTWSATVPRTAIVPGLHVVGLTAAGAFALADVSLRIE